ncbi:MFS transporter, partial [Staphylococcus haemolyticus]|uniref:MFS transporter n=1 Tax=Staphylococcus haemolyticus TaxID=1283 RepID=UPI0015D814AF
MSEGPVSTNINKVITHWIPIHQRARAIGIANAGNPLGGAIAGPIVGFLIIMWNWRVAFIILMSLGFVWTFFWLKNFTDHPKEHPKTQPIEIEECETALHNAPVNHDTQTKLPFRFYLTQPLVLATGMAFLAINYILYFFLTWFPSYLSMAKGLNIAEMSI